MNRSFIEEILEASSPLLKRDVVMLKHGLASSSSYSIKNEKDKVVFAAEAMGLSQNEIQMTFKDKHLSVTSKSKESNSQFVSNLNHKIYVGENIEKKEVKASLEKGVLTIILPLQKSKSGFDINF
jgi:HSP20 family molecular chaperone IbpA